MAGRHGKQSDEMLVLLYLMMYHYRCVSGRNKDQKLVCRFSENQTFYRLLIAVPLKMYSKFG